MISFLLQIKNNHVYFNMAKNNLEYVYEWWQDIFVLKSLKNDTIF